MGSSAPSPHPPLFEVVIPLRRPTEVLRQTIDSLVAQTDRCFAVLLSDNSGDAPENPHVAAALEALRAARLPFRHVQPPAELGRVEHWNWSHHQVTAAWIKPLFVGDWLEPSFAATLRQAIESGTPAEIINFSVVTRRPDGSDDCTVFPGGFHAPAQVLERAYRTGNDFGGPINICFRRLAFQSVGGYPPALPVSADFWLILMIALRHGLYTCAEPLTHFTLHPSRFSTNFPYHRIFGDRELYTILLAATSYADFAEIPTPLSLRNRFFGTLLQRTGKAWLKRLLGRAP